MTYDTAIIGAGPAGYSASIYSARAGLTTVLFGDPAKGNLYKAHIIGNYFGAADKPSGATLLGAGEKQIMELQANHVINEIIDLAIIDGQEFDAGRFRLRDNDNNEYLAKTVILATGQSHPLSGIRGEKEFAGRGVSYCVDCDGFFFKGRPIIVIGNTDHAAAEALALTDYTKLVTIISHGKRFEISAILKAELEKRGVKLLETARVTEFIGNQQLEKLCLQEPMADGKTELAAAAVFMAVGMAGATVFAQKLGLAMKGNYIEVDRNSQTSVPGLFAAGDCTGLPPQAAASVGSGCIAALSAIKLIRGLNNYYQYN